MNNNLKLVDLCPNSCNNLHVRSLIIFYTVYIGGDELRMISGRLSSAVFRRFLREPAAKPAIRSVFLLNGF